VTGQPVGVQGQDQLTVAFVSAVNFYSDSSNGREAV
jgi:hypothetical protein